MRILSTGPAVMVVGAAPMHDDAVHHDAEREREREIRAIGGALPVVDLKLCERERERGFCSYNLLQRAIADHSPAEDPIASTSSSIVNWIHEHRLGGGGIFWISGLTAPMAYEWSK
ncbi:hypothetical protein L7F22_030753 [Adiantum nelumboides]|nr:hypothetical protein [Adiantum nelumboides]